MYVCACVCLFSFFPGGGGDLAAGLGLEDHPATPPPSYPERYLAPPRPHVRTGPAASPSQRLLLPSLLQGEVGSKEAIYLRRDGRLDASTIAPYLPYGRPRPPA